MGNRLLLVAPHLDSNVQQNNKAASPATTQFIRNFISFLSKYFLITHINFCPDRIFPLGKLIPTPGREYISDSISAKYLNLIFISNLTKTISLAFAVIKGCRNKNVNGIIFYNWHNYYILSYLYSKIRGVKVYVYAADYAVPSFIDCVIDINYCRYVINKSRNIENIYYPGPVEESDGAQLKDEQIKENSIGYAGNYGVGSSISEVIEWYVNNSGKIPLPKLYLYGRVPEFVISKAVIDSNIEVCGYLEEPEFSMSIDRHMYLLEFRDKNYKLYDRTFPSKLLFYRKFNSFILSNTSEPLSPMLQKSIHLINAPNDISTLNFSDSDYFKMAAEEQRNNFCAEHKELSDNLVEFLMNGGFKQEV